jgi:hypothetical protein
MPIIVNRIYHSARQGLSVITLAAYVFVLATLFAVPGSALGAEASPSADNSATEANAPAQSQAAQTAPVRLFGTVEFRGELKNLPRWERIVKAERSSPTFDQDLSKFMSPASVAQWQTMLQNLRDAPILEKGRAVNNFFNRWPYKRDIEIYGVEMYWPTPAEFLRNSGMCHGYAITKFYALLKMGVPEDRMRIVALNDTIRNIGHAVLALYVDDTAYILDNVSNVIMTHDRLAHYAPVFSVNQSFLWRHVVPKAPPPPK